MCIFYILFGKIMLMKIRLSVSKKIRRARTSANLTQRELGKRLGLSSKTISAYELGRAIPPLSTLEKIAEEVKKPLDYFLQLNGHEGDKIKRIENKLDILIREVKELSKNKR